MSAPQRPGPVPGRGGTPAPLTAAIDAKRAYLADAGTSIKEVLSIRTSHRLEGVVIVLIFIETAFFVWKEVLGK